MGILQLHKNDKEEEIKHDTLDMPGKKKSDISTLCMQMRYSRKKQPNNIINEITLNMNASLALSHNSPPSLDLLQ